MRPLRHRLLIALVGLSSLVAAAGCETTAPPVEPASLTIVAEAVEFAPRVVQLPAGVPIAVTFENRDPGIPHDVDLVPMRSGVEAAAAYDGDIEPGPAIQHFQLPALVPGPYLFVCSVHPTMLIEAEAR